MAGDEVSPRGPLLTQLANEMVRLIRENYGRGPLRARASIVEDLIVCELNDGMIPIERTMRAQGEEAAAVATRRRFQQLMKPTFAEMAERLTGARVLAVLTDAELAPDVMVVVFVLDRSLDDATG